MANWIHVTDSEVEKIAELLFPVETQADEPISAQDYFPTAVDALFSGYNVGSRSEHRFTKSGLTACLDYIWKRAERPHPITSDDFQDFLIEERLRFQGNPELFIKKSFQCIDNLPKSEISTTSDGKPLQIISFESEKLPLFRGIHPLASDNEPPPDPGLNMVSYPEGNGKIFLENELFACVAKCVIFGVFYFDIYSKRMSNRALNEQLMWFKQRISLSLNLAADSIDLDSPFSISDFLAVSSRFFSMYFETKKKNTIELRIHKAIEAFGQSHWNRTTTDRFVNCIRAAEQLVGDKENLAESVSRRLTVLCVETRADRPNFKRIIKQAYSLRSKLVHGQIHELSDNRIGQKDELGRMDLEFLQIVVAKAIAGCLQLHEFNNRTDRQSENHWDSVRNLLDSTFESGSVLPGMTYAGSPFWQPPVAEDPDIWRAVGWRLVANQSEKDWFCD